ncbi:CZB domain-containing protein [Alysiella filiformis]|uniref:Chemoreceptor zinc-binding domain-containing protein n=1 Tax=Alysiella filiformis DSM 16848 TaxID=1120981 RepID=A0A286E937_9NEIS|nr:CZB domain-containing protein [Alysiella filiformis]QMT31455.1 CZB domain-containing protein [Alysiella filiformis]UBQ55533.1 CZB domain-containing protein [Alysiella filiformis DSM 16848]SOD67417.1 Chemoreceptor zinc-binding domain-containing protein [Alysiella filiformis DSM 16848]
MSLFKKLKTWLNPNPHIAQNTSISQENDLSPDNTSPAAQPVSPTETTADEPLPQVQVEPQSEPEPQTETTTTTPAETTASPLPAQIDDVILKHEVEFCGLMLDKTMTAHRNWLGNLERALRGENPSIYKTKLASDDRLCELGKWLYKNEKIFSPYPEYHTLIEAHKRFHECAGEVVEHHRKERFADAIALLRRDLLVYSESVQTSLMQLHEKVKAAGDNVCE